MGCHIHIKSSYVDFSINMTMKFIERMITPRHSISVQYMFGLAECEDISIVERLFSSSLVAIVSLSSPRKLKVCHFKKGTEICNYSYSNSILAVKLNRQVLTISLFFP